MVSRLNNAKAIGAVLTALFYGASLCLPAFTVPGDSANEVRGWVALTVVPAVCWAALTGGFSDGYLLGLDFGRMYTWPLSAWLKAGVAWLPNPLLVFAVVCLLSGRRGVALATSALAFLLGLFVPRLLYLAGDGMYDHRLPGYWLWVASLGLLVVFSQRRAEPAGYPVRPA